MSELIHEIADDFPEYADKLAELKAKREAEIRKLNAHAKILENKAKAGSREWIRRSQYEKDLATRAAVLKSDLQSWCQSEATEICNTVEGNEELIPDLIQLMLQKIEMALDLYAR